MNFPSSAKCPNCGQVLTVVVGGHTAIIVPGGKERHGITYACPSCQTCLGVEMDPISLRNEIVAQVVERLKGN